MPGFGRTVGTNARNLGVSHTRIFGSNVLFELRVGWLHVDGGQVSVNRGVDFAAQVGLQGVTRDPRDVGYPQISTPVCSARWAIPRHSCSATTSISRSTTTLLLDRGAHRVKFGGYYFHLQFRPEQPDNARGAFTYTGQFSGNAFADFLLGYPTTAVSGIGRGDQDGRTNWAAPVRAGRLARAIESDAQPRAALRIQPAHARPEQSAVVGGLPGAGRPLRHRQRRQRRDQPRGAGSAAIDPASLRDVGAGGLGTWAAEPEQGTSGAPHRLRAVTSPTSAR